MREQLSAAEPLLQVSQEPRPCGVLLQNWQQQNRFMRCPLQKTPSNLFLPLQSPLASDAQAAVDLHVICLT